MKQVDFKLILTGIFVMVFSGFERILIFLAYQDRGVTDNSALVDLTPSLIWNIPILTFILGMVMLLCGLLIIIMKSGFIKRQLEIIKKNNEAFDESFHSQSANKFEPRD